MAKTLSSIQAGIAGEYLVAAELTRRGYVASLTLRNTRGIDVLASNADATRSVGIQVKTTTRKRPHWILNKKAELTDTAENLFYVFVRLPVTGEPVFHVVPRNDVAAYVTADHQRWKVTPGRSGQPHRDNDIRIFSDPDGRYLARWELLGLDPAAMKGGGT
jgi:hypothetical protein